MAGDDHQLHAGGDQQGNAAIANVVVDDPFTTNEAPVLIGAFNAGDTDQDNLLDVGETWQYTASHQVTQAELDAGTTIVNTATVTGTGATPDSDDASVAGGAEQDPAHREGRVGYRTARPTSAGDDISYTLAVTNTGQRGDCQCGGGRSVHDQRGAGAGWRLQFRRHRPGQSARRRRDLAVHGQPSGDAGRARCRDGNIVNTATVTGTGATPDSDDASVAVAQSKILHIEKDASVPGGTADVAGETISYTLAVTNTGNAAIANVVVDDPFTTNEAPVLIGAFNSGDTDKDGLLDVGETWHYTASHQVTQAEINAGSNIVNIATVTGTGATQDTDDASVPVNAQPTAGTQSITIDEEGLANGIAGGPGGSDVPGQAITASNTLIHAFNADGPFGTDPINFSPMHNVAVGELSGSSPLTYYWDLAGDTLYASTNVSSLANAQSTAAFKVVLNTSTGGYTYTQIKPLDHHVVDTEDDIVVNLTYQVKDGSGDTANGTLTVTIDDDSPLAQTITKTINEGARDTNLSLVLDVSGSMDFSSGLTGLTRLDVLKASVIELLEQYDNVGDARVQIITFSTSAAQVGTNWMTLAQAKAAVQLLTANGSTNYDDPLTLLQSIFGNAGKLATPGVQNVNYFISDGEPNQPVGSEGVSAAEEATWTSFLNTNNINSFALGAGSAATQSTLNPVAYNGQTHVNTDAVIVSDLGQLGVTLSGTVAAVTGNLLTDVPGSGFGADGGYVKSVTANGTTYSYDPVTDTISFSGGPNNGTFNSATNLLTITLLNGATLTVDIDDGSYGYTAPPVVNANISEPIGFKLTDNDGDTSTATLTINVNNADLPPIVRDDRVITNVGTVAGDDPIIIPHYALLYNDSDPDGQAISVTAAVVTSELNTASFNTPAGSVTVTEDGNNELDGGTFTYTGTAGALSDTGLVTISRPSTSTGTLNGTGLGDILIAGSGNDTLNGNEGADVLIGNDGNDTLVGGTGADLLVGGNGTDNFRFNFSSEGVDHIADFDAGTNATSVDFLQFNVPGPGFSLGDNDTTVENFRIGSNATLNFAGSEVGVKTDASVATVNIQSTIDGFTNITTGAVFALLDSTKGHAVVYYDANPNAAGGAVLVAEIDSITTLAQMANFNSGDFNFI